MICKRYSYGSYNLYHHQLSYQQKWIHEFDVVCGRKGPIMQPISPLSCPATQPLCATHFTPLHHLRNHHPHHHQAKGLGLRWDHGARIQLWRVHFGVMPTSCFASSALNSNWILLLITSFPNLVFPPQISWFHQTETFFNGLMHFFLTVLHGWPMFCHSCIKTVGNHELNNQTFGNIKKNGNSKWHLLWRVLIFRDTSAKKVILLYHSFFIFCKAIFFHDKQTPPQNWHYIDHHQHSSVSVNL